MPNSLYNNTLVAVPYTTIRSSSVRQQLADIEAAFDAVEVNESGYVNSVNPTFSGTMTHTSGTVNFQAATAVLLPTLPLGAPADSNAATRAYVMAVLGSSGTLLPPVAGRDGHVLGVLDGAYGWTPPLNYQLILNQGLT